MSFFKVENLGIRFGGVVAVDKVSFEVKRGEVYTIIGPNGAGKTTIFNLIGLIYPATSGKIFFEDRELTGLSPHQVARPRHRAHLPEHRAVRARDRAAEPADRPPPASRAPRCGRSCCSRPRCAAPSSRSARRWRR